MSKQGMILFIGHTSFKMTISAWINNSIQRHNDICKIKNLR